MAFGTHGHTSVRNNLKQLRKLGPYADGHEFRVMRNKVLRARRKLGIEALTDSERLLVREQIKREERVRVIKTVGGFLIVLLTLTVVVFWIVR